MDEMLVRLLLHNQYEILKNVDSDNASFYEENQKILEYGSSSDIKEMTSWITATPEHVKEEVYQILEMYRNLFFSYENLEDKEGIDKYSVTFRGFDGNEECEHYSYCKHLITDKNKYVEFKDRELNSHYPVLDSYLAMVDKWKVIKSSRNRESFHNPHSLTAEQIKQIIE